MRGVTKDITGQKFGLLTVVGKSEVRWNKNTVWICDCDCGTKNKLIRKDQLVRKDCKVKSCGCYKSPEKIEKLKSHWKKRRESYIGKKFNKLTITGFPEQGQPLRYKCLCDCDCGTKNKLIAFNAVVFGDTKSCGCNWSGRYENLKGRRFGKLVVINTIGKIKDRYVNLCLCDCGNIHITTSQILKRKGPKSCGCILKEMFKISPQQASELSKINRFQSEIGNDLNLHWSESKKIIENALNSKIGEVS